MTLQVSSKTEVAFYLEVNVNQGYIKNIKLFHSPWTGPNNVSQQVRRPAASSANRAAPRFLASHFPDRPDRPTSRELKLCKWFFQLPGWYSWLCCVTTHNVVHWRISVVVLLAGSPCDKAKYRLIIQTGSKIQRTSFDHSSTDGSIRIQVWDLQTPAHNGTLWGWDSKKHHLTLHHHTYQSQN